MHLLIVDDDKDLSQQMNLGLKDQNTFIDSVYTLDEAKKSVLSKDYNMIILDYNLGLDIGMELIASLKILKRRPKVILITSFATKDVAISACNNGVDLIIEKPFLISELKDAIKSISKEEPEPDFQLDQDRLKVTYSNKVISLTQIEMKLLTLFVNSKRKILSKDELHKHLFGNDVKVRNALGVHLTNLKKKLPFVDKYLINVRGKGYIFDYE